MSAFVMNVAGFNDLANELASHAEYSNNVVDVSHCVAGDVRRFLGFRQSHFTPADAWPQAREAALALFSANLSAVSQRYSHRDDLGLPSAPEFSRQHHWPQWRPVQLLKHLQCLRYQMNEGDVPETELYQRLTELISEIALSIVTESPEYRVAAWDFRERRAA